MTNTQKNQQNQIAFQRFTPHFALKNKHVQTMYATFFRKKIALDCTIEVFELSDGDFVECYWLNKPSPESNTPITVLFHGLEGSHQSPYIQGAMSTLQEQGHACVLMHFRGCSGKSNRLPRTYHSGDTADARAWIAHLSVTFPTSPLCAIGYSLGANMLLKLLGEYDEQSPLQAAVAISAPMQLDNSADTISQGASRFYERYLLTSLKAALLKKYQQHDMASLIQQSPEDIKKLSTIRAFDDVYTSKINGFDDAQDYYLQNSAKQFLPNIQTKTLIIHALDDPFMTPAVLPTTGEYSTSIELEVHKYGGHVGFVMGRFFKPVYYLEQRIMAFLNNTLSRTT